MSTIKKGTYRFKDEVVLPSKICSVRTLTQTLQFTISTDINGTNYAIGCQELTISDVMVDMAYEMVSVFPPNAPFSVPCLCAVWYEGYWDFKNYGTGIQTITIPYDQEVSDEFAAWFNANIGQQEEAAVTIEYNGSVIASLKAGQTATLPCKDTLMHTDLVVSVPDGMGGSVEEWDGSYTVTDAVELISFTVDGTSYQAEDGMTWREWVESEYNTGGFYISNSAIHRPSAGYISDEGALADNAIISGKAYKTKAGGGGAD
jgi:hypothetical protein